MLPAIAPFRSHIDAGMSALLGLKQGSSVAVASWGGGVGVGRMLPSRTVFVMGAT